MILVQDTILQILSYLSPKELYMLNHDFYIKYHKEVFRGVYKKRIVEYIKDIINRDHAFVLSQIIFDIPHIFRKRVPESPSIANANANATPPTISMLKYCKQLAHNTESIKCQHALVPSERKKSLNKHHITI